MLINIASHQIIPEGTTQCLADRLPFTTSPSHDAIDVFDRSALLELRRAVRLQSVFKTSFSRCDPGPRGQATAISNPSEVRSTRMSKTPTTNDQSDKLPTSSGPSFVSGRLGHQRHHWNRLRTCIHLAVNPHLEASRSIFSSRFLQNRHNANATCKLVFLQRISFRHSSRHQSELVELSGIEPLTPCLQSRCSPS